METEKMIQRINFNGIFLEAYYLGYFPTTAKKIFLYQTYFFHCSANNVVVYQSSDMQDVLLGIALNEIK